LACPYFMPTHKSEDAAWLHPSRLPLGGGWNGQCSAPGNEGRTPSDVELRNHCNLGYAATCPHLPKERAADAVRFSIARDRGAQLEVWVISELGHRPSAHGKLQYDVGLAEWLSVHSDACIQKMAECYVESYLRRRTPAELLASPSE
jgi:hypothetical protein